MIRSVGFNTPSVVDPMAIVARGTIIRDGCFIGKRAVLNLGSIIDE